MSRKLNIACLQTSPRPDFESALSEALRLAERAVDRGAQFLALPEYCGGLRSQGARIVPPSSTEQSHPVLAGLRAFASERRVWILIGSLAITAAHGRIMNRGFVLDDNGSIVSRYDKIHMFDIQLSESEVYRESDTVTPGTEAVMTGTPWGMVGHTICYDLRFPGLFRDMAKAGAAIITIPAAFTRKTGEAHWIVLNRARAIENTCFVVSPCATGSVPGGGACFGHSLVVDPWGEVLADGGTGPGVVSAVMDLEHVADVRRRIPSLDHDRQYTRRWKEGKKAA